MQIILIMIIVFIWICSIVAIIEKYAENDVPINMVSIAILICPIINTLLALYYGYPEFKETLSKIFKNN